LLKPNLRSPKTQRRHFKSSSSQRVQDSRDIACVRPARGTPHPHRSQDSARPFVLIEPQQNVGKSNNRSTSQITAPADRFWQCVIGTVRKRIAIDNQQGTAHHNSLNYFREMVEEKCVAFSA